MFKKLLKLINRHKYDQAIKETVATTIFFDQFNKIDELQEELECYNLTEKLLNLQARTDKVTIKALENALKQSNNNLKVKTDYCDYLELESNKTEKLLEASELDCEYTNKVNLANVTFMQNVRAENDRLGEKLKNQNDLVKTLTADLKYKNEVIQSLESKLEKGFEATLSRGLQELSKIGNCLSKPIITKGKDEDGEYTDKTYILAKICSKCNKTLQMHFFNKDKSHKDKYSSVCKECRNIYKRKKYSNNEK